MRAATTGLLIVLMTSFASAQPTTEPDYAAIPVLHRSWTPGNRNLPLVTVGRIETQEALGPEQDAWRDAYYTSFMDNQLGSSGIDDPNAWMIAKGNSPLLAPIEGHDLVLVQASPTGHPSLTASVLKEGNTLVLRVKDWQPNPVMDRNKNMGGQMIQMIYLPPLSAGTYRLQIQWLVMSQDPPDQGSGWAYSDYRVGEFSVEVAKPGPSLVGNMAMPSNSFDSLKPAEMDKSNAKEQIPWEMTARRIAFSSNQQLELSVGAFDLANLPSAMKLDAASVPKLGPPSSDKSTYAFILGQPLSTAQWASVESIVWEGTSATINCDVWTDNGDRTKNQPASPLLIVRLNPPASKPALLPITPPGHYKVTVVWHHLLAPSPGGWYATVQGGQETASASFDVH